MYKTVNNSSGCLNLTTEKQEKWMEVSFSSCPNFSNLLASETSKQTGIRNPHWHGSPPPLGEPPLSCKLKGIHIIPECIVYANISSKIK